MDVSAPAIRPTAAAPPVTMAKLAGGHLHPRPLPDNAQMALRNRWANLARNRQQPSRGFLALILRPSSISS